MICSGHQCAISKNAISLKSVPTSYADAKICNSTIQEVKVEFKNDEKVNDAGGLLREWVNLILKELVKPEIGKFGVSKNVSHRCLMFCRGFCTDRQFRSDIHIEPKFRKF